MIKVEHSTHSRGTWLYIPDGDGRDIPVYLTPDDRAELMAALQNTALRGVQTEIAR